MVSLIADLQLLKTLERDVQERADQLQFLIETSVGDDITEAETDLIERLAGRHAEVTKLFMTLKAQVESTLEPPEDENSLEGDDR